jgi:copper chaperone CopZ
MNSFKKILIALLIIALPGISSAQEKTKKVETVKFATSIDCKACVDKIMTNLPQEKGIKDVKCDLKTKEVEVTYQKEKNNAEEIKRNIEKLGFTAKVLSPVEKEKEDK